MNDVGTSSSLPAVSSLPVAVVEASVEPSHLSSLSSSTPEASSTSLFSAVINHPQPPQLPNHPFPSYGSVGRGKPPNYRPKGGKGLGAGGAKRWLGRKHHKGMENLTKPAIRRLARRGGVKRISQNCYSLIRTSLKGFLSDIMMIVAVLAEYEKKKTVKAKDVMYALRMKMRSPSQLSGTGPVYGIE